MITVIKQTSGLYKYKDNQYPDKDHFRYIFSIIDSLGINRIVEMSIDGYKNEMYVMASLHSDPEGFKSHLKDPIKVTVEMNEYMYNRYLSVVGAVIDANVTQSWDIIKL